MGGLDAINKFIGEKGFLFEVSEADVDASFITRVTPDGRKIWSRVKHVNHDLLRCDFMDWRTGEKHKIYSRELADADQKHVERLDKKLAKERLEQQLEAKRQVEELLSRWRDSGKNSHYLDSKKLTRGVRDRVMVRAGEQDAQQILVIPMQDETGEIWNLQQIFASGRKAFHTKARTKGVFHKIEAATDVVYVGEGFATCLAVNSVAQATVFVAFSVSNLEEAVRVAVKEHGAERVVLLADWDGATFVKTGHNPGMHACQRLACKYGVRVAWPLGVNQTKNIDFADLEPEQIRASLEGAVGWAAISGEVFKKPKPATAALEVIAPDVCVARLGDPVQTEAVVSTDVCPSVAYIIEPPNAQPANYDQLSVDSLPDVIRPKRGMPKPLDTLRNFEAVMRFIGATLRYNVILKDQEWFIPGESASVDNYKNVLYARLMDLCARVGLPKGSIEHYLTYLCDKQQFNPVVAWVESKPWDGVSRLEDLFATVGVVGEAQDAAKLQMKKTFIRKWMLMALAAAYRPTGVAAPGMLVFQGPQYVGKTKWLLSLVPKELNLAVDGKIVDTRDKDSVKQTVKYWLVELGELDATFRKSDLAALKAFIGRDTDTLRPAYAKSECHFARRTVFFGSVNEMAFLADKTGNRRYWTLEVERVNWAHGLDMQQIWAELAGQYRRGEPWWLSGEEMAWLNESNKEFEVVDAIEERLAAWDWDAEDGEWLSSTQILGEMGFANPSSGETQKCANVVRKLNRGRKKRAKGVRLVWTPRKRGAR